MAKGLNQGSGGKNKRRQRHKALTQAINKALGPLPADKREPEAPVKRWTVEKGRLVRHP